MTSSQFLRRQRLEEEDFQSSDDSTGANTAIDKEFNSIREVNVPINEQSAAERVIQSGKRKIQFSEPLFLPDDQESGNEQDAYDDEGEGEGEVAMSQINSSIMYSQDKRGRAGENPIASQFDDQIGKMSVTQFKLNSNKPLRDTSSSPSKSTQSPKPRLRNNLILSEDDDENLMGDDEETDGFDKSPVKFSNLKLKPIKSIPLPLKSKHLTINKVKLAEKRKQQEINDKSIESFSLDSSGLSKKSKSVFDDDDDDKSNKGKIEMENRRKVQELEHQRSIQERRRIEEKKNSLRDKKKEERFRLQQLQQMKIENRLKEREERKLKKLEQIKKHNKVRKQREELALQSKIAFDEKRRKEREMFQNSLARQSRQVLLSAANERQKPSKINKEQLEIENDKHPDIELLEDEDEDEEEEEKEISHVLVEHEEIPLATVKKRKIQVSPIPLVVEQIENKSLANLKSQFEDLQLRKQKIREQMEQLRISLETVEAEEQSKVNEIIELVSLQTNNAAEPESNKLEEPPVFKKRKVSQEQKKKSTLKPAIVPPAVSDTQKFVDEHMDALNDLVMSGSSLSSVEENGNSAGDGSYISTQPVIHKKPIIEPLAKRKTRRLKENEIVVLSDESEDDYS